MSKLRIIKAKGEPIYYVQKHIIIGIWIAVKDPLTFKHTFTSYEGAFDTLVRLRNKKPKETEVIYQTR